MSRLRRNKNVQKSFMSPLFPEFTFMTDLTSIRLGLVSSGKNLLPACLVVIFRFSKIFRKLKTKLSTKVVKLDQVIVLMGLN